MKKFLNALVGAGLFCLAGVALAQDGTDYSAVGLVALSAAIAIGAGAVGAASGQGKAASAALEGIARNPSAKDDIFTPMILSLVFMEFQALLGFAVAFLILGKV